MINKDDLLGDTHDYDAWQIKAIFQISPAITEKKKHLIDPVQYVAVPPIVAAQSSTKQSQLIRNSLKDTFQKATWIK